MKNLSPLQEDLLEYRPLLPKVLEDVEKVSYEIKEKHTQCQGDIEEVKSLFPHTFGRALLKAKTGSAVAVKALKVGVVFSGGQASGGHNVIVGLFEGLKKFHPDTELLGFLGGPQGILDAEYCKLTEKGLHSYRNQGGFDLIGSGRTKIETSEQLEQALQTAKKLSLDGLVVIGGDDSNTNAAVLAEYFAEKKSSTKVVGIPKTIDGDLKNEQIPISFGHDTACKVYAESIGNIARDCLSAKKYTHFIRLMGRSASHITLECALQTHPNYTFISEEVEQKKQTLQGLVKDLAEMISSRAEKGKNYGVILIPEGLIEFIPECKQLIQELNSLLAQGKDPLSSLSEASKVCFLQLPREIQNQLLLDRDPHGNVQVSHIETEGLLIAMLQEELQKRKEKGTYRGSFKAVKHFFGYEGRCSIPSRFDCHYCYALGVNAAALLQGDYSGYMSQILSVDKPVEEWEAGGIPITMLFNMEERKGRKKPVIQKALVELEAPAFRAFAEKREEWKKEDCYRYPGPLQFYGPRRVSEEPLLTLQLESKKL